MAAPAATNGGVVAPQAIDLLSDDLSGIGVNPLQNSGPGSGENTAPEVAKSGAGFRASLLTAAKHPRDTLTKKGNGISLLPKKQVRLSFLCSALSVLIIYSIYHYHLSYWENGRSQFEKG